MFVPNFTLNSGMPRFIFTKMCVYYVLRDTTRMFVVVSFVIAVKITSVKIKGN